MDQQLKEKTLEKLTRSENILIVLSGTSGFGGLASSLALLLSLEKLGKNVSIFGKTPTVSDARKLYGVDKVAKPQDSKNLVIVVDEAVNSVDKVTYFLDEDKLKIVVHPLPGTKGLSPKQISFEEIAKKPELIFAIGFNSSQELEEEFLHEQYINSNIWLVSINAQEMSQKFAHASFDDPQASGLSEITAQFIHDLALPVDEDISYNLYSGVSAATDNFSPAKTRETTFQIAAWLIKFGAGRASFAATRHQVNPADVSKGPLGQPTGRVDFIQQVTSSRSDQDTTAPDQVEMEKRPQEDWFKPPKVYKGSKSFDKGY